MYKDEATENYLLIQAEESQKSFHVHIPIKFKMIIIRINSRFSFVDFEVKAKTKERKF